MSKSLTNKLEVPIGKATPAWVECNINSATGKEQLQINETYDKDGELAYARRGVSIPYEHVQEVMRSIETVLNEAGFEANIDIRPPAVEIA